MKSLRLSPTMLGVVALGIWVVYITFVMLDLYLRYPVAGIALRLLVPWAALCNLVGIGLGLVRIRKDQKRMIVLGLVLNAVPPMIAAGFFLWLFFGFKM